MARKIKPIGRVISKIEFLTAGLSVALLIFFGIYFYDMTVHPSDYIGASIYEEKNLNFSMAVPSDWTLIKADESLIAEVVKETTGGVLFDTRYFKLSTEITPVTLVKESHKGGKTFNRVMFIAFFGTESISNYMSDTESIETSFRSNLEEMGAKDIEITGTEELIEENLFYGLVTMVSATINDTKVYFTQYLEPAGQNILRVVHSSTDSAKDYQYDLESVLKGLIYEDTNLMENIPINGIPSIGEQSTETGIEELDIPEDSDGITVEFDKDSTIVPTEWEEE